MAPDRLERDLIQLTVIVVYQMRLAVTQEHVIVT